MPNLDKLFIHATAARHFSTPDGSAVFDTKPEFLGEAPGWLKDDPYFGLCVKDGTITYVGAPPALVTAPGPDAAKAKSHVRKSAKAAEPKDGDGETDDGPNVPDPGPDAAKATDEGQG